MKFLNAQQVDHIASNLTILLIIIGFFSFLLFLITASTLHHRTNQDSHLGYFNISINVLKFIITREYVRSSDLAARGFGRIAFYSLVSLFLSIVIINVLDWLR